MDNIRSLFPTKKGPGVLVIGRANHDASLVFEELSDILDNFYETRNNEENTKIFVPEKFQLGKEQYKHIVYSGLPDFSYTDKTDTKGNIVDRVQHEEDALIYARLNVKHIGEKVKFDWDKNADYPTAALELHSQKFWAYFNVYGGGKKESNEKSMQERDNFLQYIQRQNDTI